MIRIAGVSTDHPIDYFTFFSIVSCEILTISDYQCYYTYTWNTWSRFEAVKLAPWPSRRLHHLCKFRAPNGEIAFQGSYCLNLLLAAVSWLVILGWSRMISSDFLSSCKFEFSSFNTFDVTQIYKQRVVQARPKHRNCISLKWLSWVSVCCQLITNLVRVLDGLWFLFCAPLYHLYLAPCVVLSSKYI